MVYDTGAEDGVYWQRPWRLKAAVVYGWRGHRQQLSRLTAHPNELLLATAGRGNVAGQELEVLRCWNLAYAAAGNTSDYSPLETTGKGAYAAAGGTAR